MTQKPIKNQNKKMYPKKIPWGLIISVIILTILFQILVFYTEKKDAFLANILFSTLDNSIDLLLSGTNINKLAQPINNPQLGIGSDEKTRQHQNKIVVAVIDTGIALDHSLLRDRLNVSEAELIGFIGIDDDRNGYVDDFYGYDFLKDQAVPQDTNGHGTHISGIILGRAFNKQIKLNHQLPIVIMPLRIINTDKFTSNKIPELISEAINYAVDNGADIINLSLGSQKNHHLIAESVKKAESNGVIIVAAAGNHGQNFNLYPAAYPYVIAVSSNNAQGEMAAFANYGEYVDVYAPGEDIFSTGLNDFYEFRSGTSQSTALVTHWIAEILSEMKQNHFSADLLDGGGGGREYILQELKENKRVKVRN
jgi:hypothetical protein